MNEGIRPSRHSAFIWLPYHPRTMWSRRFCLSASAALLALPSLSRIALAAAPPRRIGRIMVIGGAEDKLQDKVILRRFVELSGGTEARIRVISAASGDPEGAWQTYDRVFGELGVADRAPIYIPNREAADSTEVSDQILGADGIFLSGGDQRRLMDKLWETQAFRALHVAFHLRGSCIGGTSAGAAALSRNMLVQGEATRLPEKEAAELDIGLGFVANAIVDQHFSERGRLGRLLSALAQRPDMLGIGVDEDTALVIERGQGVEVIGQGAVTVVDGRRMQSNHQEIDSRQRLELLGVRVHLLPAGHRYGSLPGEPRPRPMPPSLDEAVDLLVAPGPIRG